MVSLAMPPVQVQHSSVPDFTPALLLPLGIALFLLIAITVMVCYSVRGAASADRPEILRAAADLVRAVGDALRLPFLPDGEAAGTSPEPA